MPENEEEKTGNNEKSPEQELEEARKKADEYLESWKRSQADFINYKRRAEQERLEMGQYANAQLILSLLPVLDDLERAFENATPKAAKSEWAEGIKLIESKFRSMLASQGLTPIESSGKPFDPALHEAVLHGQGEEGIVVKELRRGYKLQDKVLRPSQVIVGNGETETTKKET